MLAASTASALPSDNTSAMCSSLPAPPLATTDRERHETFFGDALDDIDHGLAPVRAGGDVEEHHFVRALFVVTQREFDGVADVAQFARFGPAELNAARDLAIMHVQAGNDAF